MASKNVLGILITVTIVLLIVSYFMIPKGQEGFNNPSYTVRNLEINTCPIFAPEIQTAKGKTDCCQGDMIDGKCNGKTFCTKSPAYDGIPGCVDAWRQHFMKKGIEFLSTAFDLESLDLLWSLKPKRIKIPSGEITNLPYLRKVGSLGIETIMSTGMSTMKETWQPSIASPLTRLHRRP